MSETVKEHKEGLPWKSVGRFNTYHEANIVRLEYMADLDLQVKVHRVGPRGCFFSVKTRVKPELQKTQRRNKKLDKRKKKKYTNSK
jgi:hypothetical protein|tara:strand:- start:1902 stop:2159 length:258 start_codon:yes stop_codon:yes gene_type:complete